MAIVDEDWSCPLRRVWFPYSGYGTGGGKFCVLLLCGSKVGSKVESRASNGGLECSLGQNCVCEAKTPIPLTWPRLLVTLVSLLKIEEELCSTSDIKPLPRIEEEF